MTKMAAVSRQIRSCYSILAAAVLVIGVPAHYYSVSRNTPGSSVLVAFKVSLQRCNTIIQSTLLLNFVTLFDARLSYTSCIQFGCGDSVRSK
jgi:hypothetical protein